MTYTRVSSAIDMLMKRCLADLSRGRISPNPQLFSPHPPITHVTGLIHEHHRGLQQIIDHRSQQECMERAWALHGQVQAAQTHRAHARGVERRRAPAHAQRAAGRQASRRCEPARGPAPPRARPPRKRPGPRRWRCGAGKPAGPIVCARLDVPPCIADVIRKPGTLRRRAYRAEHILGRRRTRTGWSVRNSPSSVATQRDEQAIGGSGTRSGRPAMKKQAAEEGVHHRPGVDESASLCCRHAVRLGAGAATHPACRGQADATTTARPSAG